MEEFLPVEAIRALLSDRGHHLCEPEGRTDLLGLDPPEDVYLTVALQGDATLFRRWRRRYFVCRPDHAAILAVSDAPVDFASNWAAMSEGVMAGLPREVIAGLATWTATRLIRQGKVYVWTPRPMRFYGDYLGKLYDEVVATLGSTVGPDRLRRHIEADPSANAAILDTSDPEFPALLASYFLLSSQDFVEVDIAVEDGSEAFEMHHHDKVIVSIPDASTRSALVTHFSSNPDIFEDISEETSGDEPEDTTDEEWS